MPIITFEGESLTKDQKEELVHRFTETASEVTGVPKQFFVMSIRENHAENLGFGGETVEELKKRHLQER
ncbi:MAG: tautomerase family protein [Eubacteriaceae bacterium]|jgi:Uncharacterized protein, 4-oxalocrotonate tautomerase homolog|nr:tautomerase family protein [Eubacteriaceae bacterium]